MGGVDGGGVIGGEQSADTHSAAYPISGQTISTLVTRKLVHGGGRCLRSIHLWMSGLLMSKL